MSNGEKLCGINIDSFRKYWLQKQKKIENDSENLSELDRARLIKKIESSLSLLREMEEDASDTEKKIRSSGG
jgi:hypothetical protein